MALFSEKTIITLITDNKNNQRNKKTTSVKTYYTLSPEQVLTELKTDPKQGLSTIEAKKRLTQYGYNQLESKKGKSFIQKFFSQFKSFMIIILIIAAIISGVVGILENEGLFDTYVILGILILNALIGAYQEHRAESSLEALKNLASPLSKVLRDGVVSEIDTREIVPGDIVILETGAIIPADIRLTETANLKIQESALTGESFPVDKNTDTIENTETALGDRKNMAYTSGMVTYGRGRGVVVHTAMQTQVGKIAHMLKNTADTKTPMSLRLEQLGKILGIAALAICTLIFVVGILYGNSVLDMFMTAVSLAVAAIPEGLPAVSTVVLAIGVQRMVKQNAIVRTLPAVETLGSATVICSDKTGTLTQNKMTVVQMYQNHQLQTIDRNNAPQNISNSETDLIISSVLCSDAFSKTTDEGKNEFSGDPTETALLDLGVFFGIDKTQIENKHPRIAEIPFDSERKRMATINKQADNTLRINVKGGVDEVLSVCKQIVLNGTVKTLSNDDTQKIHEANHKMAQSALRVLAIAYSDIEKLPNDIHVDTIEQNLVFTGLVGMIDPARPEAFNAVQQCNTAGIRPVMITGDHKDTAMAIAREIGILKPQHEAITGSELEKMTDEELVKNVSRYSVYARVAPEHKVRIVSAWQKNNNIVAMTGDGVNDAPALKQADIGAAMGIVGTDVAKGASDIILTDDNFATIVAAVKEGRRIYDNILKAILFLLSTNVGEIFLIFITAVFNMGVPLLPVHILWINLVSDSLPALALSIDPADEGIMKQKPKDSKKGIMTKGMIWRIMYQGVMIGTIPLIAFVIGLRDGGERLGQTMAFASLIFAQMTHIRNLHSIKKSSFRTNPLQNLPLIGAIAISTAMALAVLIIEPAREAFKFTTMDSSHWLIVVALAFIPIIVVELFKLLKINDWK